MLDSQTFDNYQESVSFLTHKKTALCRVQIQRLKDWETFDILSHLGRLLKFGDEVVGFDLTSANMSTELEDIIEQKNIQSVILVYKYRKKIRHKKRVFKLKRIVMEEEETNRHSGKNTVKDYNEFLDELEQDKHLRKQVDLYIDEEGVEATKKDIAKKEQEKKQLKLDIK